MKAAKGRPHGRLLYGYRREYDPASGALLRQIPDEATGPIVQEAAARVLAGETPYAVAEDLNSRGVATPRPNEGPPKDGGGARRWDLTQVRRMLINPGYAGLRVHRGDVVGAADWPGLIGEAEHYALVAKLTDPRRRSQRDSTVKHLLTGIARCGVCGNGARVLKQRESYHAYICTPGFHVARKQQWVDDFVTAVVIERLSRPDALDLLAGPDDEEAKGARAEAAALRARLDAFYDQAAGGELTPQGLARIEATLLPQIDAADRRARRVAVAPVVAQVAGPRAAEVWQELPIAARREVIRELLDVKILPGRQGIRTFDPKTVRITWKEMGMSDDSG